MRKGSASNHVVLTMPLQESNLKHSINGFMYCNMPGLEARLGQRVRWLHTPAIFLTLIVHPLELFADVAALRRLHQTARHES